MIGIYLIHSAHLVSFTTDQWGERIETTTPVRCRVESKSKLVTDREGNNIWSIATVLLPPGTTVDHDMRFRFRDRDYGIVGIGEGISFSLLFTELTIA